MILGLFVVDRTNAEVRGGGRLVDRVLLFSVEQIDFEELNVEGLADVDTRAGRALLLVSDDGAEPARYVVLPFAQLLRDNPALK